MSTSSLPFIFARLRARAVGEIIVAEKRRGNLDSAYALKYAAIRHLAITGEAYHLAGNFSRCHRDNRMLIMPIQQAINRENNLTASL